MPTDYKNTLQLPKTDFPMKADLVEREPKRMAKWAADGLYPKILEARAGGPKYILHDGPPFANGDIHMGTAFNKLLKDFVVKSKSMAGFDVPFIPGWDCHGLPIEFKVLKESTGISPLEVRQRSHDYATKFLQRMEGQFQRLGVLGKWEEAYKTLDPAYEADIVRSFATFVEKGLVYRAKKPVYWSTGALTALAEAEVEYENRTDPAIYVKFPVVQGALAGKASMVIWTTTPWTLPANLAIAVDPRQEYVIAPMRRGADGAVEHYVVARPLLEKFLTDTELTLAGEGESVRGEALAGAEAQHPFLPRTARVITADFVTADSGTGQVHIAPGHGADDYIAGRQNGLEVLSPVDDHGRLTEEAGVPALTGKYVFDANQDVVEMLRANGTLLAAHPYLHSYPHCWRSKTPVVFRAVEQFFIRIDAFRQEALTAIDGVQWIPEWGRSRISGTVAARPDWCISRQRTWGVPLPVFYQPNGEAIMEAELARKVADLMEEHGSNLWFSKDDAWWAETLGLPAGTTRRQDTLDVWIDSGVSHTAVMRRRPELGFPADLYLEATDQHRGWFQSSLLTSIALHGEAPYRTVITHGFVVDKDGRKISKSSDYQKPMDAAHFVNKYGADIVRLWVASVDFGSDVPFSEENFKRLGEAYRGFRNIMRVLLGNLGDFSPEHASLAGATTIDHWMLQRLGSVIETCVAAYSTFDFRKVFQTLNQFVAVEVSALYVDVTKDRLYCDAVDSPRRRASQTVMAQVLDALTRLLAPILAFTADEAWEHSGRTTSVHLEKFPTPPQSTHATAEADVAQWVKLRGIVSQEIEAARQQKTIGTALDAAVTLELVDAAMGEGLHGREEEVEEFFILSDLTISAGPATKATLTPCTHQKCARCWRRRLTVGTIPEHPELCDRCAAVVGAAAPVA